MCDDDNREEGYHKHVSVAYAQNNCRLSRAFTDTLRMHDLARDEQTDEQNSLIARTRRLLSIEMEVEDSAAGETKAETCGRPGVIACAGKKQAFDSAVIECASPPCQADNCSSDDPIQQQTTGGLYNRDLPHPGYDGSESKGGQNMRTSNRFTAVEKRAIANRLAYALENDPSFARLEHEDANCASVIGFLRNASLSELSESLLVHMVFASCHSATAFEQLAVSGAPGKIDPMGNGFKEAPVAAMRRRLVTIPWACPSDGLNSASPDRATCTAMIGKPDDGPSRGACIHLFLPEETTTRIPALEEWNSMKNKRFCGLASGSTDAISEFDPRVCLPVQLVDDLYRDGTVEGKPDLIFSPPDDLCVDLGACHNQRDNVALLHVRLGFDHGPVIVEIGDYPIIFACA